MIILDQPYISDEMIRYLEMTKTPVLKNDTACSVGQGFDLYCVGEEEFISLYQQNKKIYTVSENSLAWIQKHIPDETLHRSIQFMKDKARMRKLLKQMYPDFFFLEVGFDDLLTIDFTKLPKPLILKPSVGFFSIGVYTIRNSKDWQLAIAEIQANAEQWSQAYPDSVVGNTKFLLEEYIYGEEYAIDGYYDQDGNIVILNILKHDFASFDDVSDRLYYTSKEIIESKREVLAAFLNELNVQIGAKNFPLHAEVRCTESGQIIPIELNPLRFAGLCCTDLSIFAYGFHTYDYYLHNQKPNWDTLLKGKDGLTYALIVLNQPQDIPKNAVFDYEKLEQSFEEVLCLRKVKKEGLDTFGFVFTKTDEQHWQELERIKQSDLKEFLK